MSDQSGSATDPLVSIGLPVYNGDLYLEGTLQCLLSQVHRHVEIVISDNASTDKTQEICQEYRRRDARVKYHRTDRNMGMVWNFRRVFALSHGEFFMWAAHDDYWAPTFVSELLKPLTVVPACVASFCHVDVWYRCRNDEVSSPGGMPALTFENTAFENFRQLLLFPQSALFYGLFRRDAVRRTAIIKGDYFDWGDVFCLQQLSLLGRMSINESVLFRSGVRSNHREGKSLSPRRLPGFRYAHSPFLIKSANLIARARCFSIAQKGRLLTLLGARVMEFLWGTEPIVRPVAFPLHLAARLVLSVDRRCFSTLAMNDST